MKRRSKVNQWVINSRSTLINKEESTTRDEGLIIIIVNSTITIKNNSTTAKKITDKAIDRSIKITRTTKMHRINANTSLKSPMKTVVTIKKIGSMRERTLKSLLLMIKENRKNSTKIVDNMRQKTSKAKGRMWIQATRKFIKKWKIRPNNSKWRSRFHPKIDLAWWTNQIHNLTDIALDKLGCRWPQR